MSRLPLVASLALIVLTGFAGCGVGKPAPPPAAPREDSQDKPQMYHHSNGLQLLVSDTLYRVTTVPEGFVVEPASGNEDRRAPLIMSIRLLAGQPEVETHRTRIVGTGRSVRYTVIDEEEGGSGGVDYTLIALEQVDSRWIQYRQRKQSEHGEPEFELWDIAAGVSYLSSR